MQDTLDAVRRASDFLRGKRTYIVAAVIGLVAAARYLGWLDSQAYEAILGLLTGGGLASLRASKGSPNP